MARRDDDGLIRLNKVLASWGIDSRRHVEEMIIAGRITVDGVVATEKGMKVRPDARVEVDGKVLEKRPAPVWLALHKPKGYVCTREDSRDRPIVMDLLPLELRHVHSIGRLDGDVTGLILFTNQGELTHRLAHPSFGVNKVYQALTMRPFTIEQRERLQMGVALEDGPAAPAMCVVRRSREGAGSLVELTIHEGRKHQVKRMFEAVGNRVAELTRIRVGPVELGALGRAEWRHLTREEVEALYASCKLEPPQGANYSPPRPAVKVAPPRTPRPSESADRPRREYSSDRPDARGPRREYGPERYGDRGPRADAPSDRPHREYSTDRPRYAGGDAGGPRQDRPDSRGPRREYSSDRGPRAGAPSDRPRREYSSDRGPRAGAPSERPRREYGPERYGDRGPRAGAPSDRPRREYSTDRPRYAGVDAGGPRQDRPDSRGPRREYTSDRGPRAGAPSDRPRREYGPERYGDRGPRAGGGAGAPSDRPRREQGEASGPPKPRGRKPAPPSKRKQPPRKR